jgi:glutaredoxin
MRKALKFMAIAIAVYLGVHYLGGNADTEKNLASELAANNQVIMYSLTTCGYCVEKREALRAAGIPFNEYFVDQDGAKMQELREKLAAENMSGGRVGTPSFVVNGELLINNPSMEEIKQHLHYKS